jgi:hypothetical protein
MADVSDLTDEELGIRLEPRLREFEEIDAQRRANPDDRASQRDLDNQEFGALFSVAQDVVDFAERRFPGDERLQDSFLFKDLPEGLGSTVPFLAAALAASRGAGPGMSAMVPAVLGTALSAEEGAQRAIASDADPEQVRELTEEASFAGALEGLPVGRLVSNVGRIVPGKSALLKSAKTIIESTLEEMLQEGTQAVTMNVLANRVLAEDSPLLKGAGGAARTGGAVGAVFGALGAAFGVRLRGRQIREMGEQAGLSGEVIEEAARNIPEEGAIIPIPEDEITAPVSREEAAQPKPGQPPADPFPTENVAENIARRADIPIPGQEEAIDATPEPTEEIAPSPEEEPATTPLGPPLDVVSRETTRPGTEGEIAPETQAAVAPPGRKGPETTDVSTVPELPEERPETAPKPPEEKTLRPPEDFETAELLQAEIDRLESNRNAQAPGPEGAERIAQLEAEIERRVNAIKLQAEQRGAEQASGGTSGPPLKETRTFISRLADEDLDQIIQAEALEKEDLDALRATMRENLVDAREAVPGLSDPRTVQAALDEQALRTQTTQAFIADASESMLADIANGTARTHFDPGVRARASALQEAAIDELDRRGTFFPQPGDRQGAPTEDPGAVVEPPPGLPAEAAGGIKKDKPPEPIPIRRRTRSPFVKNPKTFASALGNLVARKSSIGQRRRIQISRKNESELIGFIEAERGKPRFNALFVLESAADDRTSRTTREDFEAGIPFGEAAFSLSDQIFTDPQGAQDFDELELAALLNQEGLSGSLLGDPAPSDPVGLAFYEETGKDGSTGPESETPGQDDVVTLGAGLGAFGDITGPTRRPPANELERRGGSPNAFQDPEIEVRYQNAREGAGKESLIERVKAKFAELGRALTRPFIHLEAGERFAVAKEVLRQSRQFTSLGQSEAVEALESITRDLNDADFDLFSRHVLLRDLVESAGLDLPFGFTADTALAELSVTTQKVSNNPAVSAALKKRAAKWEKIRSENIEAMGAIGVDLSKRFTRKDYFRHQVLFHAQQRSTQGTGRRLRTPPRRGFQRRREGSELDINANYIQAEFEVMSQMAADTRLARAITRLEGAFDIMPQLRGQLAEINKGRSAEDQLAVEDILPEGFELWQPRPGSSFYFASSIPESVAAEAMESQLREAKVAPEDIRRILAKGAPFKQWALPSELAAQLNELAPELTRGRLSTVTRRVTRAWKVWTLLSPTRIVKYNARNLGEVDRVIVGNPKALKRVSKAFADLHRVLIKKELMGEDMRQWFEIVGIESLSFRQELGDVDRRDEFARLSRLDEGFRSLPRRAWSTYWSGARKLTNFRESILRYANYLEYLDQIRKTGAPENFGASIPEEITALGDPHEQAAKLSNDLLGAYDSISVAGQDLRDTLLPFWSFQETNMRAWYQLMKNATRDDRLTSAIGQTLLAKAKRSPVTALRTGGFVVKAIAVMAVVQAYNRLRYPEEEESLPEDIRARPHIILGHFDPETGEVPYFSRLGTFNDLLDWFGLDDAPRDIREFLDGKRTVKEIAEDTIAAPVIKLINMTTPLIKTPAEQIAGRTTFPDFRRPRQIRDRLDSLATGFGVRKEFRQLTGRPVRRRFPENIKENFIYLSDPEATAYWAVKDDVRRFSRQIGKPSGFSQSPRSVSLYYYKQSLRYGDPEAAGRYLAEYAALGGTKEGLAQSTRAAEPLFGLNEKEKTQFKDDLNQRDKKKLEQADVYYRATFLSSLAEETSAKVLGPSLPQNARDLVRERTILRRRKETARLNRRQRRRLDRLNDFYSEQFLPLQARARESEEAGRTGLATRSRSRLRRAADALGTPPR